MREVDVAQLEAALEQGSPLLDVRELSEYAEGHVPGARAVPLGQAPGFVRSLEGRSPVYLICWSGTRSGLVADVVAAAGLEPVNVTGGMSAWIRSGRPVERGLVGGSDPQGAPS